MIRRGLRVAMWAAFWLGAGGIIIVQWLLAQ
jgi:hypothetical protein